jgi:hypothetical protein
MDSPTIYLWFLAVPIIFSATDDLRFLAPPASIKARMRAGPTSLAGKDRC